MKDYDYHSALQPEVDAPALDRWEGRLGIALTHDLAADPVLPTEFAQCDVLYAEPPWKAGWDLFHRRVGREPAMPYAEFIRLCSTLISNRRGVLILGKHAERYALPPRFTHQVKLHDVGDALALWYRCVPRDRTPMPSSVAEVLGQLSQDYYSVGDFCAGYGYTGKVFAQAGKRFVLSDVNPRCTGYLSQHADGWGVQHG